MDEMTDENQEPVEATEPEPVEPEVETEDTADEATEKDPETDQEVEYNEFGAPIHKTVNPNLTIKDVRPDQEEKVLRPPTDGTGTPTTQDYVPPAEVLDSDK